MTDNDMQEIRQLYMDILETTDLSKVKLEELMNVLKPESLFERFAARKAANTAPGKDFLSVKWGPKYILRRPLSL